jgi:hypothetical protein
MTTFAQKFEGLKNHEVAERLLDEFERTKKLAAEEARWLTNWISAVIRKPEISEKNFDQADCVGKLQKAWGWAVEFAKKIWSLIVRFFQLVWKAMKDAWSKGKEKMQSKGEAKSNVVEMPAAVNA